MPLLPAQEAPQDGLDQPDDDRQHDRRREQAAVNSRNGEDRTLGPCIGNAISCAMGSPGGGALAEIAEGEL